LKRSFKFWQTRNRRVLVCKYISGNSSFIFIWYSKGGYPPQFSILVNQLVEAARCNSSPSNNATHRYFDLCYYRPMSPQQFQTIWDSTDRRRMRNPYQEDIAFRICELVAAGWRLTEICTIEGSPSYQVLCKWRRQNSDFNALIVMAYADRLDHFVKGGHTKKNNSETYRQIGVRYPSVLKRKKVLQKCILATGIRDHDWKVYL
jgi:hypothetical protein